MKQLTLDLGEDERKQPMIRPDRAREEQLVALMARAILRVVRQAGDREHGSE